MTGQTEVCALSADDKRHITKTMVASLRGALDRVPDKATLVHIGTRAAGCRCADLCYVENVWIDIEADRLIQQVTPTTKFVFEQGPMISACTLTASDGGGGFVFCAIPGGTPEYQIGRDSAYSSQVVNAPRCDTHAEFVAFVKERFA